MITFKHLTADDIHFFESVVGENRVSMGRSVLDLHASDQSYHPASPPDAVVWPITRNEVAALLKYANIHGIPVTGWGGGSSVEGNPIPVWGGLVLDFSQMARILNIRESDFQADVEPGVFYQDLNEKLRHKGLFFPPDPGARATIGGMLANNASGVKAVKYGGSRANLFRLVVVLSNGEILEMGTRAAKTSSGYDLMDLFVGAEGTLGIIVEATVRLQGLPEAFSTAIATFPTVEAAADAVFEIKRSGLGPASLEFLSPECVTLINKENELGLAVCPTLFIEFHGPVAGPIREFIDMSHDICKAFGCYDFIPGIDRAKRGILLKSRYELAEIIMRNHPGRSHTVIDVAVPVSAYPEMISSARAEAQASGIPGYVFGHAGDGNVHLVFMGKTGDAKEWAVIDQVNERIVKKAIAVGGTATGEHGTGIGKRKFMSLEHGDGLAWMKRIKDLFDPNGILNPGKIFP